MRWYKFALLKAYFDKGYGVTAYIKWLIAFYGISSLNTKLTLVIGCIYAFSCFFIGWFWYHLGIVKAEIEVGNQFNEFVRHMRKDYKVQDPLNNN